MFSGQLVAPQSAHFRFHFSAKAFGGSGDQQANVILDISHSC